MRIHPTQVGAASGPTETAEAPAVNEVAAVGAAADLWLPPGYEGAADPARTDAPKLWIPERYGRPRTDAEQSYYRGLIAEGQALVDGARAQRITAAKASAVRLEAARAPTAAPARHALKPDVRAPLKDEAPLKEAAPLKDEAPLREAAPLKDEAPTADGVYREADGFIVNAPGVHRPRPVQDANLIRAGLKAEVPHRKQIGGTCGLYALGMVMDLWHQREPQNPTALVQPEDRNEVNDPRGFVHFHHEPTDARYLMDVAKDAGFTAKGEMYEARFVADTASRFGYEASLRTAASLDDLYTVLDAGHPAIVPFNVDMNGEAGTPDSGARAHYAVVQGYFEDKGERYVVAKHSWSNTEDHVWKAKDFLASWSNLKTTKFYGTPGDGEIPKYPELKEPKNLGLPDAGGGRADISQALARTLVEVVPPGEALTGGRRFAAQAVDPKPA